MVFPLNGGQHQHFLRHVDPSLSPPGWAVARQAIEASTWGAGKRHAMCHGQVAWQLTKKQRDQKIYIYMGVRGKQLLYGYIYIYKTYMYIYMYIYIYVYIYVYIYICLKWGYMYVCIYIYIM